MQTGAAQLIFADIHWGPSGVSRCADTPLIPPSASAEDIWVLRYLRSKKYAKTYDSMTSHLMLFKSFIQELLRSSKHICTVNVLQYWPRMLYKVQNQNNTSVLALQAFHAYKLLYLCNNNNNNILPKVHHIAAQLYLIYRFIAVLFLSSYQVGVNRKFLKVVLGFWNFAYGPM